MYDGSNAEAVASEKGVTTEENLQNIRQEIVDPIVESMLKKAASSSLNNPRTSEILLTARQVAYVDNCILPGAGMNGIDDENYQSIYFVRHAHKQDIKSGFGDYKTWTRPCDTPLSYEGTVMAMETGSLFAALGLRGKIDRVIVSPALRCLQTAKPISEALDLELNIEEGLYDVPLASFFQEAGIKPETAEEWDYPFLDWPTLTERRCYFTNLNINYQSTVTIERQDKLQTAAAGMERDYALYIQRCVDTIQSLLEKFRGENLCIVSHALNIAVMAAVALKVDYTTVVGKWDHGYKGNDNKSLLGGLPCMASVTRIYREKIKDNRSEALWKAHPSLTNCVGHLTRTDLARAKGFGPGMSREMLKQFANFPALLKWGIAASPWEVVDRKKRRIDSRL